MIADLSDQELIDRAFAKRPVFRIGFDAHVKAYRSKLGIVGLRRIHAEPGFRTAYEARTAFERDRPLPPWKDVA